MASTSATGSVMGSLPPAYMGEHVQRAVVDAPFVTCLVIDTSGTIPITPSEAIAQAKRICGAKPLHLMLSGRSLRIDKWGTPAYANLEINREIFVKVPATVWFNSLHSTRATAVSGRTLYLQPAPIEAVGDGVPVSVHGSHMEVSGPYLTEADVDWILAAAENDIHSYILPFTEKTEDITGLLELDPAAKVIVSIDSDKGVNFVRSVLPSLPFASTVGVMIYRPEVLTCFEDKTDIIECLQRLIQYDAKAISNLAFTSLLKGPLSQSDVSDLHLLRTLGYKNFFLRGPVCLDPAAMQLAATVWKNYTSRYPLSS
ncbi:hypothetical protein Pelo_2798 [Pelomyxa schiedti]|nr:hypothetical protein Pelo_2798 [Pelomyxa schiedti]